MTECTRCEKEITYPHFVPKKLDGRTVVLELCDLCYAGACEEEARRTRELL